MLTITRGDPFGMALVAKVRVADPITGLESIQPADLTGWQIAAALTTDPDVVPVKKYPMQVEITEAADGTYVVSASTDDWPLGLLYWRVRYTTASGQKTTTKPSPITIIEGI